LAAVTGFFRKIPSRVCAFFVCAALWLFILYAFGAGRGWTDAALGFLLNVLTLSGILAFATALLAILANAAIAYFFRVRFGIRAAIVYFVAGALSFLLAALGASFTVVAEGRL
jgi:hypothetical protein